MILRDNGLYIVSIKWGVDYDNEKSFYSDKKYDSINTMFKAAQWILE